MGALRINISNLSEGTHQRSLESTPEEIGLDSRFTKPVQVDAALEKTSRQLLLEVRFTTGGVFSCDRCLDDFEKELAGTYRMLYVTDNQAAGEQREEIQVIPPDANEIELDDDVRQYAVLALPQKMLCREECAGLCPSCGANRNHTKCACTNDETDPRWAGLKKLLEN